MRRRVFDPRLFDGPELFDTNTRRWQDLRISYQVAAPRWIAQPAPGRWAAARSASRWRMTPEKEH